MNLILLASQTILTLSHNRLAFKKHSLLSNGAFQTNSSADPGISDKLLMKHTAKDNAKPIGNKPCQAYLSEYGKRNAQELENIKHASSIEKQGFSLIKQICRPKKWVYRRETSFFESLCILHRP